jgi:hypothetical protein
MAVGFASFELTVVGCVRFMAARPFAFFVLPKKVTKERRAHEGGRCATALRCSGRAAGVANSLPAVARTGDTRKPRSPLRCSAPSRAGRAGATAVLAWGARRVVCGGGRVGFASRGLTVVGCVRFMAARPVTFLVLPRKVTKRRRAHEGGRCATALRCSVRAAGVANSLPAVARTGDARRPRSPLRCSAPSRAGRARARSTATATATATATPSPSPSPPPGAREGTAATWARRSTRLASVPSPLQGERVRVRGRGWPLCHRRR